MVKLLIGVRTTIRTPSKEVMTEVSNLEHNVLTLKLRLVASQIGPMITTGFCWK